MNSESKIGSAEAFTFSSSVGDDVWHSGKHPKAYEWWYFDALSDDGNEAVTIVFLDNFIYSPRHNRLRGEAAARFPAVSFTYFRDGKPLYRTLAEFSEGEFSADSHFPECTIGGCSFKFESASYGSGYTVAIDLKLSGDRRLVAAFEWLSVESNFAPEPKSFNESSHMWNMVAPRSDVSGRITVYDKKGKEKDVRHFRGTGYHDHNIDDRWLAKTIRDWHWGRAHFADATAVFYRYCGLGDNSPSTKLFIIKDGQLTERTVQYEEQNYVRDKFGIRYPTRLRLISDDDVRLRVKPLTVIDSSFYYLRFASEVTLSMPGESPHTITGITEFLAPRTLKYRWLSWISDIRIGKNGRGPLL